MSTTIDQFNKQLSGSQLKAVYLLAGEEHLLLLEAADALRGRARELGYSEREVLDVESGFDWDALARAGASMSLFATQRLIDLRLPTGKPGKEGAAALIEYCAAPPVDTILLITCSQWSKKHEIAWVAAVEKAGSFIAFWPMKPEEFVAWVGARMRSRGLKPDRAAIDVLASRVEGNSLAAAQEIDKLVLLHGEAPLDAATLESLVADSARFDVFKLVEAALCGDSERALRILAGLHAEGEQIPALMGWVLNQLQLIARLSAASGNLSAAFSAERIWPGRQNLYRQALNRASSGHWQNVLRQAARVDRICKGRGFGNAWIELERLLVAVAMPRARGLVAADG
ncbi:MAG TPA: DNA polymerase III subunit delta [Rudaea sp.]|nr:DNA polymerase III subunit delta [Rudaea sp.]